MTEPCTLCWDGFKTIDSPIEDLGIILAEEDKDIYKAGDVILINSNGHKSGYILRNVTWMKEPFMSLSEREIDLLPEDQFNEKFKQWQGGLLTFHEALINREMLNAPLIVELVLAFKKAQQQLGDLDDSGDLLAFIYELLSEAILTEPRVLIVSDAETT